MKTDKRRSRGVLSALVADPYRKLAAIGLAIGLWFFIDSQITGTTSRTVPLVTVGAAGTVEAAGTSLGSRLAVVLPTDRVIGLRFMDGTEPISQVKVVLSGPSYRIAQVSDGLIDLRVTAFAGLDWSTRRDIEFTAADIRRDLQGVEIELDPPRIRLEVERIKDWPVKLSFDVVELPENPFGNRLRTDLAEFSPETVHILGPASGIDQIRGPGLMPLRARITSSGTSRQVTAVIELTVPPESGLRLAETPSVTIPIRPSTHLFELELPLVIDDLALPPEQRGLYQADARTRFVRIRAGGALQSQLVSLGEGADTSRQQNWASANLRLLVHLTGLEQGVNLGPELVREAHLLLLGSLRATVDRSECFLDETVSVTLRKKQ